MANEISLAFNATAKKAGAVVNASGNFSITMSGAHTLDETQSIATSATAVTLGAISGTPAFLVIQNLDATNYLEVDSANTFDKFPQKIPAGGFGIFLPETGTIYAKANTAAVIVRKYAASA